MKRNMQLSLVSVFTTSIILVSGTAYGATPTSSGNRLLPVPIGGIALSPGSTTEIGTITDSQGKVIPIYATAGIATSATPAQVAAVSGKSIPSGLAASASAATSCWSARNYVSYGPSWATLMTYAQTVYWCGNGSTISSQGQNISGSVTALGSLTGWQYGGVLSSSATMFYNNWAYQEYTQGLFHQCAIVTFACTNNKYPYIYANVYANGTYTAGGGA